jgi:hypothetical protein
MNHAFGAFSFRRRITVLPRRRIPSGKPPAVPIRFLAAMIGDSCKAVTAYELP